MSHRHEIERRIGRLERLVIRTLDRAAEAERLGRDPAVHYRRTTLMMVRIEELQELAKATQG